MRAGRESNICQPPPLLWVWNAAQRAVLCCLIVIDDTFQNVLGVCGLNPISYFWCLHVEKAGQDICHVLQHYGVLAVGMHMSPFHYY